MTIAKTRFGMSSMAIYIVSTIGACQDVSLAITTMRIFRSFRLMPGFQECQSKSGLSAGASSTTRHQCGNAE